MDGAAPQRSIRRLKRNIPILMAVRGLFWLHFFGAVLAPFFTDWGGLTFPQMFALNAWFMACGFAFETPTGLFADRFGRRLSLAAGGVLAAMAALFYVTGRSLPWFVAGETLMALAYALHSGADEALGYDTLCALGCEAAAPRLMARLEAAKLTGINVATLSGAWIAARWGLGAPMAAYVGPAVLVAAMAFWLEEPPRRVDSPARGLGSLSKGVVREFLRDPALRSLSLELAITNALAWGLIWLFQPALAARGLPIQYFGFVHASACLGQIAFLAGATRWQRGLGSRRRLLQGSTLVAGFALIALGWVKPLWAAIPAIIVAFSFSLPRVALYSACFNARIPSARRAALLSVASMMRTLAIVLLNPVVGWSAGKSLRFTFTGLGVALAAAALFSPVAARHFDDPPPLA